jgi:hypothetical protein
MGELDPSEDVLEDTAKQFDEWASNAKFILPPKQLDGRIQVGGRTLIGVVDPSNDSDMEDDEEEVRTIGESSSEDEDSEDENDQEQKVVRRDDDNMDDESVDGNQDSDSDSSNSS